MPENTRETVQADRQARIPVAGRQQPGAAEASSSDRDSPNPIPETRSAGAAGRERRSEVRHAVNLPAVAVRAADRLPPSAPARVSVTVVDISRSAVRWFSKEIFYRRELVGLRLDIAETGQALSCVVEVHRTRRLRGMYEVVGAFVRVKHADQGAARTEPRTASTQPPRSSPSPPPATPQVE